MKYVPIPISMLEVGKPLPVNVVSDTGQLLLRKGQPIVSEQHREKLHAFNASTTPDEAAAWQTSYERMVHQLLREGVDVEVIARASMPSTIRENDYAGGTELSGGWLDLQEVLRGILYQGGLAMNPLRRLKAIAKKAAQFLEADPDDSLFVLFQALADDALGYSATHALLCAVVCDLTAAKLGLDTSHRESLMAAALTMNIGMARDQDSLSRQTTPPNEWQRALIKSHAEQGATILQTLGVDDADQLDIVRWHHQPEAQVGIPANQLARSILAMADVFVAKVVARKTRSALSPLGAAKSIYLGSEGMASSVGSAMATCIGFYPPGTYLRMNNGEMAVAVQRGLRANTPWAISIVGKDGMPMTHYHARSTAEEGYSIAAPVNYQKVRVAIPADKVRRARERIPRQV